MSIAENIVGKAHQRGIRFLLEDDKLRLKVPQEERIDQELLDQIRQHKDVIKSFLKNQTVIDEPIHQHIRSYNRNGHTHLPLSFAQERLWFIDRLQGSVQYHMPWVFNVKGELDVLALEDAFRSIIQRHEVLRSVIEEQDGVNGQRIISADEWKMECKSVEELANTGQTAFSYLDTVMLREYDLQKDFMLRACLVSESANDHLLLIMLHHIAFDGLSIPVMINELQEFYSSIIEKRAANLPSLPLQYADYAIWQREYLSGELLQNKTNYWKEKLQGVEPLALPLDHARPLVQSVKGGIVKRKIDKEIYESLAALSSRAGTTLFMTMLAAFKVLLFRYSGQRDICVGSPVAGRQQQEIEGLIGFFVNMLSLRTHMSGEQSMKQLLQSVRETTLEAYTHQEVPFEKVVEALGVERDMSRTPVFQVSFALQNIADVTELQLGTAKLVKEDISGVLSKFDLHLDVVESAGELQLELTYCSELFREDTIGRMLTHYENLLEGIIKNIDCPIAELPLLSLNEERQLLEEFNDTEQAYPKDKNIIDLFEEQVRNYGNETALVFEDEKLNYQELDHRSNQLAHYLISKGVKTETLVPVCIDRSPEMIIALFAILKAGGAYVPIDSSLPDDRIGYMLKDTGADIIITTSAYQELLSAESSAELVCVDLLSELLLQLPIEKPNIDITPDNLAYVIYTSGSTGLPKGVMIEHAGVVNLVHNQAGPLNLRPGICVFQFASFSFDASCYEIFLTLLHGGQLVMSPKETLLDTKALSALLNKHAVELITLPTSYQSVISEEITAVKTVVSAGEALNPKLAREIQQKGIKLINAYGPTENTVCAALSESPLHESGCVIIGKPIGNVEAYILDGRMQPVPVGVMGELYLGGAQVARGYLNREELTAERFVGASGEWRVGSGKRVLLYKTGDLARWLPDGNIEYLGREDDQVKIRGYRIEIGEIETVLQQAPGVKIGVVVVREGNRNEKQLIAYILPNDHSNKEEVTAFLKAKLPDYMVPSLLVELNELPLTSSGKVDKKRLPEVDASSTEYIAPRTEIETQLAEVWQELLSAKRIGIFDNFFRLGGHSLLAMRMVSAIRKKMGKEVAIKEIFNYPTIAALATQISTQLHNEILPAIRAYDRNQHLPLSFSQERLWFIDRLQGSVQYHMPWVFKVKGSLDVVALEDAFRSIIQRHEVLRSVIEEQDGVNGQRIISADEWKMECRSVEELANTGQTAFSYLDTVMLREYDLQKDFMLRACLVSESANDHLLLIMLHHIAFDGLSIPVMINELQEFYSSIIEKRAANLPSLPLQYADYAIWQREYLSGELLQNKTNYWKEKLQGLEPLALPLDHARPSVQSVKGGIVKRKIDKEIYESLALLSSREGTTLFMTMLAAFKVLLFRYSGQQDICVGSPVAGRQQQEIEGLIGFFVNMLSLRMQLSGEQSMKQLLQSVRETTLEAYTHQEVPFEKVVEALGVERDMSRTPVFQVSFALQNIPIANEIELGTARLTKQETGETLSKFDLNLDVLESTEGLQLELTYCSDLFHETTIERFLDHYQNLLSAITKDINCPVSELPLLSSREEKQLIEEFNDTARSYPKDKTILDLFSEQARNNPADIAIVFKDEQLTYKELDERSNQLAHYLTGKGVTTETLVPVCMDRSPEMIVALLAVLKAGGAYVPIDPEYPLSRIEYMLEDTGGTVIICNAAHKELLGSGKKKLICIDADSKRIARMSKPPVDHIVQPCNLAYVIYTSGSTGKPKGVMIEHGSLLNFLLSMIDDLQVAAAQSILAVTTYSFDISGLEMYMPLLTGGKIILATRAQATDGNKLRSLIHAARPTYMQATPSTWQLLLEAGWMNEENLIILTGGEALPASLKESLTQLSEGTVWNLYGPTETTIWSTIKPLYKNEPITIGRPIANTTVYILDKFMRICPVGVFGELCIGGDGLSRGYLNKEELTSEKFVYRPSTTLGTGRSGAQGAFGQGPSTVLRVYRTGDLARWLPNGEIEYAGRIDDQVKLRGHRIELGEIESVLDQAPGINKSVAVVKEFGEGDKRLVAYVLADETFNRDEVLAYAKSKLPDYMVPGIICRLATMPLTPNGKVDRRRLRAVDASQIAMKEFVAPRTVFEEQLASAWQQLLGLQRVSINDNFFELGGHSLLAMRMAAAVQRKTGKQIAIKDIFNYPTIAALASQVNAHAANDQLQIQPSPRNIRIPLSFAQERLWFIDKLQGTVQYHMPALFRLKGALDLAVLEASFRDVLQRHEVLRTVIKEEDGLGYQFINPADAWKLHFITEEDVMQSFGDVHQYIHDFILEPFDLSSDAMLRVCVVKLPGDEYLMAAVLHHIAFDGWSVGIMVQEFMEFYRSRKENRQAALKPLPIQYADFAVWQRANLHADAMNAGLEWWKQQLEGVEPFELLTDHVRPAEQSIKGAVVDKYLDKQLLDDLKNLSRQENASLFMVLMAAFKILMHRYTGQDDICVGSPIAGRQQPEVEGLAGLFVNTLALRSNLSSNPSFASLLQQVKQVTLQAYEHQEVPFERVVEALGVERDMSRNPLFQVMFALQNMPASVELEFGDVKLTREEGAQITAQIDIDFTITESENGLRISVLYCSELYEKETINVLVERYQYLLKDILTNTSKRVSELAIISTEEERLFLNGFNAKDVAYPHDKTIVQLFAEQVRKTPRSVAAVFENESLTYAELDARSNQLAALLVNKGVKKGDIVPVLAERNNDFLAAMLGIFKSGGVYVPLDVKSPLGRNCAVISECEANVLICSDEYLQKDDEHFFRLLNAHTLVTNLVFLNRIEDLDKRQEKFHAIALGALLDKQPHVISNYISDPAYKSSVLAATADEFAIYLRKQHAFGKKNIALFLLDTSLKLVAGAALNSMDVAPKIIAAQLSRQQKNQFIKENNIGFIISEAALIDEADAISWENGCEYVLVDEYMPELSEDNKVEGFKSIWDYQAEISSEAINDYGWNNSYDKKPFTIAEMDQYVQNFSSKLQPHIHDKSRVLEVGCGHGLVLTSIAPKVSRYVATDLSEVIIQKNKIRFSNTEFADRIAFEPLSAIDIHKLESKEDFDVVVSSSIVHYFPNTRYLEKMIAHSIGLLKDKGLIYLDDLLDLQYKQALIDSAIEYNKTHKVNTAKTDWNNDLFVPQEFFYKLKKTYPEIAEIEITRKIGSITNELTRFRYDVLIRIDKSSVKSTGTIAAFHSDMFAIGKRVSPRILENIRLETKGKGVLFNQFPASISDRNSIDNFRLAPVAVTIEPTDLAYIIYTSGSTGFPKGAMIEHAGMVNHIYAKVNDIHITNNSVIAQNASHTFDISVWQFLSALVTGGSVVIYSNDIILKPELLLQKLQQDGVTILEVVPSYLDVLLDTPLHQKDFLASLQFLLVTGEAIRPASIKKWFELYPQMKVVNAYGPTEAADDITHCILDSSSKLDRIPVGAPVQNMRIYIADKYMRPCPAGITGEICVSGVGVGRGYVKDAAKTQKAFLPDPFRPHEQVRMYKTGDVGYWRRDGQLEFLGRRDSQVKVRGYRIELGEIETILLQAQGIKQAVVIVKEDGAQAKRLIAYVVAEGFFNKDEVMAYVKSRLPEYMVPSTIIPLENIPLTANGKVDRKRLPEAESAQSLNQYTAPRTEAEQQLAMVWQDLLGVERVCIEDNFFELGGDSIVTIQVVSRMKRLGYELTPRDIFLHQTIAQLSAVISNREQVDADEKAEQGLLQGSSGLLPIQQAYFEIENGSVSHYNQSLLLAIDKKIDAYTLEAAVKALVKHHDSLRFVYTRSENDWQQAYGDYEGKLDVEDIHEATVEDLPAIINQHGEKYQRSLNIEQGLLIRVVLMLTPGMENHNRLLVIVHHLAIDGVSWRILLEDLGHLVAQKTISLPAKTNSYREWYNGLVKYSESKKLLSQKNYWEQVAQNYVPLIPETETTCYAGDMRSHSATISAGNTSALLQHVSQAYHTEINDFLLASLGKTLTNWSGQSKIVIGLEGHGRKDLNGLDISRTTGWFTSLYPVLLEMPQDDTPGSLLKAVKEQLRKVPDNGIGYGVLKYINKEVSLQQNEAWDIVFNYLGQADNVTNKSKWFTIADEAAGTQVNPGMPSFAKLEVDCVIRNGSLIVNWNYSSKHFNHQTIELLAETFVRNTESLIAHCLDKLKSGESTFTPFDLGLQQEVNYAELDSFLEEKINGKPRKNLIESIYKLSALQEGVLFQGLYDTNGGAYLLQKSCMLGTIDLQVFQLTWNELMQKHSILRTAFHHNNFRIPVQAVYSNIQMPVNIIDYSHLDENKRQEQVRLFEEKDRHTNFDFNNAPLTRISLLKLASDRYKMIWTSHHLILDGWSVPVLVNEFLETYDTLLAGRLPVAKEDKYENYIQYIQQQDKESEEAYWRGYLQGLEGGSLLPFIATGADRTRGVSEFRFELLQLNTAITEKVEAYARQHHFTLNTLMQGVWAYLLHAYTGNEQVVYGVTVAGRPEDLAGMEKRVGMYINALPLHTQVRHEQHVNEWLQVMQQEQLHSREFQYASLNNIQNWIGLPGDLFDSMITFQNFPVTELLAGYNGKLEVSDMWIHEQTSNYPFSIRVILGKEINVQFIYKEELMNVSYVSMIRDHFENVLLQIIANVNGKLGDISLLTEAEQKLLDGFNNTGKNYSIDKTIPELFEEQVELYPNEIALVFQEEQLTFRELDNLSNQFAYYLQSKGVKEETLVPVCLDRSVEVIVAIMGILKAGGAYVPVDPAYPAERISYMLEDIGADIIVTSSDYRDLIQDYRPAAEFVCMDTLSELLPLLPSEKPDRSITSNNLAYVIYTSGSTGLPKGVMIEHRGVINLTYNQVAPLNLRPGIRVFQFASFSFDASCHEIFTTILHGGRLVLAPKETLLDTKLLAELLKKHEIELVTLPPSYQSAIGDEIGGLKTVISAGEALNTKLAIEIQQKGIKLINAYGPTENTVSSILSTDPLHESGCVTIGKPLDNVKAYILDSRMTPVPVGVTGELYLGGVQLARGYWNRPELSAERFVHRPSTTLGTGAGTDPSTTLRTGRELGERVYKTGDLARWLPDGNIEYMGRADDQVKIRGYRVELGEIETVLQQAPGVKLGVVIAKEDKQGTKKLIAYIVHEGTTKEEVTVYLKSKLPDYMVPSVMIEMESLPLNNSGKVDRKKLPDADSITTGVDKYKAATNETEAKLVAIWQELLEVERIGIEDDFFESGGHSLLAIQLISAIRKEFGKEIAIKDVFDYPSISLLAEQISSQTSSALPVIQKYEGSDNIPLSFAQERLWFIDRLQGSLQYHMPWVYRLTGELNIDALQQSFRTIINRHEVLRTVIKEEDGRGYQQITGADQWQIEYVDATDILLIGSTKEAFIEEFLSRPYDLSKDPMLHVIVIRLSANEHLLVALVHHIAFDGWSISVMVEELTECYQSIINNRRPSLKELPVQYKDYAAWQRSYLAAETLQTKLAWWKDQLSDTEPITLPTDYPRTAVQSTRGGVVYKTFNKEITGALNVLSKQQGVTLFMTLLGAFKVLLHRYTGQPDICVGTPVAGRLQQEMEGLIGLFVNTLALRSAIKGEMQFAELLQQVKQTTLQAYEHQDVPFEKIVDALGVERDMSRTPVFQVMFALQNMPRAKQIDLGGLILVEEDHGQPTSQFDISIEVSESADGLNMVVNYCSELFKPHTIGKMLVHYENLLHAMLADVNTPVARLQMLTNTEEKLLLHDLNNTTRKEFLDKCILQPFAEQVAKSAGAIAVVSGNDELTYAELNELSDQLAHYLQSRGVQAETLVPVCINRSLELVISILAIMKAGGVYVPVEPKYPSERIGFMLQDTAAALVLTNAACAAKLPSSYTGEVICLDEDREVWQCCGNFAPVDVQPNNAAYVIYTSGSTGQPKGTIIRHDSLYNLCQWYTESHNITAATNCLLIISIGFDASIKNIIAPLMAGGLVIMSADDVYDPSTIMQIIQNRKATLINCVPNAFIPVLKSAEHSGYAELESLERLAFGGEALDIRPFTSFLSANKKCIITNIYGPTECTDISIAYEVQAADKQRTFIPVGRPIPNMKVFILDASLQLVPHGIKGEICIEGVGLARHYLNQTELTAEKFVTNPLNPATKLYRTGDIGRWLPDGNIEYLGRMDDQVKIRGFRIEPGETENALKHAPGVKQAVVVVNNDQQGRKKLAGYVVTENGFNRQEIMDYLSQRLPDYMMPSSLIAIKNMPLTANGKVDKKNLPAADDSLNTSGSYEAPGNEIEEQLALIWQELLGIKRVGITDNFFELGGDSIITIQVVSRMKRLGYEISPKDMFLHQTIAGLAGLISKRSGTAARYTGEQEVLTGTSGLLPIQQLYFESQQATISHYNQDVLLGISKNITAAKLRSAIPMLLKQHDSLRFSYNQHNEKCTQVYGNYEGTLDIEDLRNIDPHDLSACVQKTGEKYQRSLDIEKGELTRFVLVLTPDTESHNRLLVIVHHLAIDGVSWRILLEDLEHLLTGKNASLPAKTSSYRQWYNALVKYSESKRLVAQQAHWNKAVQSCQPLKAEKIYDDVLRVSDMGVHKISLDASRTRELLQEASQAYRTEINDILLACLSKVLCRWNDPDSYRAKIVIGLEGHGREAVIEGVDVSRTTGWFTTLYPVWLELPETNNNGKLLKSVKEQLRSIPDKGIGYGVLRYINKETSRVQSRGNWDVVFNYLGQSDNVVNRSKCFVAATEPTGNTLHENAVWTNKLEINSIVSGGELVITWNYSNRHFEASTIELLAKEYVNTLGEMIEHCVHQSKESVQLTPSDFGISPEVGYEELDNFIEHLPAGKTISSLSRLSSLQKGILFHSLYDNSGAYIHQVHCNIKSLNIKAFKASWNYLLKNHSILRCGFDNHHFKIPVQVVYDAVEMPVNILNCSHLTEVQQQIKIKELAATDLRTGFDFTDAPLMRVTLVNSGDGQYRMIWTFHHLILDGWSIPVLIEEFLQSYDAFVLKNPLLQVEEDKYEDYIHYTARQDKEKEEAYWRTYLDGLKRATLLPFIAAGSDRTTGVSKFREVSLVIKTQLKAALENYAQQHHLTLNTIMQAVWSYLLYRYTGNRDVVFGIMVSGRPEDLPRMERRIGMYINALPLYTVIDEQQELTEWMRSIQNRQMQCAEYQYASLPDMQNWIDIPGELFDSMMTFQNYPVSQLATAKKWQLQVGDIWMEEQTSNYPLSIRVMLADEITIQFIYKQELLNEVHVCKIRDHFEQVLLRMIESNTITVSGLDYSPANETSITEVFADKEDLFDFTQPN